jgi:molybdopterin/thiamine biosynthesis adenylyltransferase
MTLDPMTFDYSEFTTRNLGFVTPEEQARLRAAQVFVAGVGGMGGACVQALVRAGVGRLVIADIDTFETSNLNRQVFAFTDTLGRPKAEATADALRRINPGLDLEVLGAEWTDRLPEIASRCPILVNGCDDIPATIHLYRTAQAHAATVIDAYAAPLPSVIVVRPRDPRPEARLGYPTRGKAWREITEDDARAAFMKEIEYVLTHSSAHRHVDLKMAAEMAAGARKRMSFAPMVISTGCLMAYEALSLATGRRSRTDFRGWFFNPYDMKVERPLPAPLAAAKGALVRRFMRKLLA